MPIKKKPADVNEWKPENQPEQIIDPDDAEIDDVFADFPQNDTCIELFRVNAQGGRPQYLEQMTPSIFSFAYVCEKFGGGKYFARGKYKDGSRVRLPFEIAGDPYPVQRKTPAHDVLNPERMNPVYVNESSEVAENDGGSTALVSMMRLMLNKMENNEEAFLRKMSLYKELFGGSRPEAPLDTAISMFTKGLELAGQAGMAETNPWIMLAKEFKEPLGKIVDTVQLALAKQQAIPAQAQAMTTPPIPANPKPEVNMIEQRFKMVLPVLVNGAARNADPSIYADLILDQTLPQAYNQLKDWLSKPDCLDELCKYEPGIRFQQEWWTALRAELLSALNEAVNGDSSTQSPEDSEPSAQSSTPGNTLH